MKNKYILSFLALASGVLLSLMIMANSYLARFTTPLTASWLTHGIGTLFSLVIYFFYLQKRKQQVRKQQVQSQVIKKGKWFGI
nr:DMT family transporter [Providencia rettgeri]